MAHSSPLIRFDRVSKRFGDLHVLDEVSFDLRRGRTTVLVGPSGAGKSTVLRLLVGLVRPDAGHIYVGDDDVHGLAARDLRELRKRFGMLFQEGALFNSMSVLENVAFPLRHHSDLSPAQCREKAMQKLESVGLDGSMARRSPDALSGGQRKRVGLARALALDPEIVLFDEPTSGLDPITSAAIDALIVDISRKLNTSFFVITHDVQSCRAIADDVGLLYQGRLLAFGPGETVLESSDPGVRQFFDRQASGPLSSQQKA